MKDEDKLRSCTVDLLKDLIRDEDPKFVLLANMLDELTRLLADHVKDLTDIVAIVDRVTNTKLNINEALVAMDTDYYFTTSASEYYAPYGTHGGIMDQDKRLIITDKVKDSKYSRTLPVINPELLIVLKDGFIDFLKVHRIDYEGGHLSYSLRYNDLGGTNENQ